MSASDSPVRENVVYTGRVQGVGFRATCMRLAEGFTVTGWVRNCADGSVELEAQGTAEELARFRAAIAARFAGNIRQEVARSTELKPGERGFEVRH